MPTNQRELITMAERRFPVRIRIAIPPGGLGQRYARMATWLDENCGADGWAMTPPGMRGVLNHAVSIYFTDATLASAFVARWCRNGMEKLSGKTALVTGSTDGVGRLVARKLGQAGARVPANRALFQPAA